MVACFPLQEVVVVGGLSQVEPGQPVGLVLGGVGVDHIEQHSDAEPGRK